MQHTSMHAAANHLRQLQMTLMAAISPCWVHMHAGSLSYLMHVRDYAHLQAILHSLCYALLHDRCSASALDPTSLLNNVLQQLGGCDSPQQGPRLAETPDPGACPCLFCGAQDKA